MINIKNYKQHINLNEFELQNLQLWLALHRNFILIELYKTPLIPIKTRIKETIEQLDNLEIKINNGFNEFERRFILSELTQLRIFMDKQKIKSPKSTANELKHSIYQDVRLFINRHSA